LHDQESVEGVAQGRVGFLLGFFECDGKRVRG
jgi:hypothetical protein